jgi:transcriptional regulator
MYSRPPFQIDRTSALNFAQARGFGLVCTFDGRKPIASSLPFHLSYASNGTPRIAFHVARPNPLAVRADGKTHWLLAIAGSDAYVSPDWYASPHQVPTWLYQSVHLGGPVWPMTGGELLTHLDELSANFEQELAPKPIWKADAMPPGRLKDMARAVTGLVMYVEGVEASFKLNQHKSDADHVAVTQALAVQKGEGARDIARQLQAQRPALFDESPGASADGTMMELQDGDLP